MDMSVEEWTKERNRLEDEVIAASLRLLDFMAGSAGFKLPIKNQNLVVTCAAPGDSFGNPDNVKELESEITEDAAKLYELKHEKFIEIEVPPESAKDPHLFVTIGPDDSPPDDEPDDEFEERP